MCLLRGTDWIFKYNLGYMLYMDLRTISGYFPIQHYLTVFYNRDGECLLHGTDWVFKYNLGYMLYMDLRTISDCFPILH